MTTNYAHDSCKLTSEQTAAVKQELDALLNSEQFSGTERCHDFLEFVVNRALSADYESLTERTLGAELFGRPIDYETGSDAIVRVRANDVRRRMAQYYSKARRISQVSISLPTGSYIPEFHWNAAQAQTATPDSSEKSVYPAGKETLGSPSTGGTRGRLWSVPNWSILIGALLLLAVSTALTFIGHKTAPPGRALKQFWQPLIHDHSSVIVCFGNTTSYWPSATVKQAIDAGNQAFTVPPGGITERKDDSITEGNLRAAMSISNLLYGYGVSNELRWPQEVQSEELNRANVVFVGAFNNPWSMSLNEGLRFSFKQIHPGTNPIWTIQDRTSPGQVWSITIAYPEQSENDYALITRIIDREGGGRVKISVGGLSQFGTQAAGEFLTNEEALNAFERSAPSGWEHRNLQIVLGMRVDGRKIVNPRVLATNFW